MHKVIAHNLWKLLSNRTILNKYKGKIICRPEQQLSGFHQWADGKPIIGIVYLKHPAYNEGLHLLLIQWKAKQPSQMANEYYLVFFPENRQGPYVEMWKTKKDNTGVNSLLWEYAPRKRDGKNSRRKQYFKTHFQTNDVLIDIPDSLSNVPDFIEECFILVDNRLKADTLDKTPPADREGFPEGKEHERRHKYRERNPTLVRRAKEIFKSKNGYLYCEVCNFNFPNKYGVLGKDFIEAHHTTPISEIKPGTNTRIEDIALVCANCHRMLHRKRPWVTMSKLKSILCITK